MSDIKEEFIRRMAEALEAEFSHFLRAPAKSWTITAAGLWDKIGVVVCQQLPTHSDKYEVLAFPEDDPVCLYCGRLLRLKSKNINHPEGYCSDLCFFEGTDDE